MQLKLVGVGHALVDILAEVEDAFLDANGLPKGIMTLIDMQDAEQLYNDMPPARELSGGSVANSLAGFASLGGACGFIGRVRDDQLGGIFRHDLRASGVLFTNPAADNGVPTGRSLIFITPDAQRTMCTYLGAGGELTEEDLDEEMIRAGEILYLEGYLWDNEGAKNAFLKAAHLAHKAGRKVALTLSDPFCVDRHRESFLKLVQGHVDILFANEHEILSLFELQDLDAAAQAIRGEVEIAALTRSEKGSIIVTANKLYPIEAAPPARLVDATGAGDLYAAGFLYGLTHGLGIETAAQLASRTASEVIAHIGPRPQIKLAKLLETSGSLS